jgi:hypothetical protein
LIPDSFDLFDLFDRVSHPEQREAAMPTIRWWESAKGDKWTRLRDGRHVSIFGKMYQSRRRWYYVIGGNDDFPVQCSRDYETPGEAQRAAEEAIANIEADAAYERQRLGERQ